MKSNIPTLAILTTAAIIGLIIVNTHQVFAPRTCGGCVEFKKLTHELEKNVIEAATIGDPRIIPDLLQQYNDHVSRLFTGPE